MIDDGGVDNTAPYDGADAPEAGVLPGLVGDRYAIERQLGAGGMSLVFAARDRVLGRAVALKVIRGHTDPHADARLMREARAMAKLSHPNVIQVFDVGIAENGPVYVAMELVDGVTLDRFLRERAPDPSTVLELFRAAGRGLAAAHAAGLVHRDFKPENVMVGDDGRVRVLDFGLARAATATVDHDASSSSSPPAVDASLTSIGTVLGTPRYMSPEQWRGEPTDARTDQFSFCISLAAAFGQHPFLRGSRTSGREDTDRDALRTALLAGHEPMLAASVPTWLAPVLRRGLAARRDDRFATTDDLVRALVPAPSSVWSRRRLVIAGVSLVTAAIVIAVVAWPARSTTSRPQQPADVAASPVARSGFQCGPYLQTYAVAGRDGERGVRCVLFARDRDGAPWLAWYGEGVRDGAPYRQLGESRLGELATHVDFDDTHAMQHSTRLAADGSAATPPLKITVGDETWLRTSGLHTDYHSPFTSPPRACPSPLVRYRVFETDELRQADIVRCMLPGGRTWLGGGVIEMRPHVHIATTSFENERAAPIAADICNLPGAACGQARHGALTLVSRDFPGIGAGFENTGIWRELWFPSRARHGVRLHVIRENARPSLEAIARSVRRANELLAPAGIELFFIADESGPDVTSGGDAARPRPPNTLVVQFRSGAVGGCSPAAPHDAIVLAPSPDDGAASSAAPHDTIVRAPRPADVTVSSAPRPADVTVSSAPRPADGGVPSGACSVAWDDRLARALAYHLGFDRIPDARDAARVEVRFRARKLE